MITNKKLMEKILVQTNTNNDELREQLKKQILSCTSSTSENILFDLANKYELGVSTIIKDFENKNFELKESINSEIVKISDELTEKNHTELNIIREEYDKKINFLNNKINERFDLLSEDMINLCKVLSDNILNLQKDNSIIMESLHIILTNLLINGVSKE